jgi:hypothetical protein
MRNFFARKYHFLLKTQFLILIMKKNLLTLLSVLLISTASFAQFKVLATGNGFEEPEDGYAKIIQEKSGNTFFLHITKKDGINVRVYDNTHKQVADKHLIPKYGKLKLGSKFFEIDPGAVEPIKGIYEIDNNIVLFISEYDEGRPKLYRLVIDGKTGDLKSEETIATLGTYNLLESYAVRAGYVPLPTFYVRKDEGSDNYAVVLFDALNSDRNRRIEIVHYNKDHKEISRAFYQSPNDAYKYLSFMDLCVRGNKELVVVVVGKNTRSSGGDLNGTLLMGSLKAGATSFDLQRLAYPDAGKISESMIRYNKVNDEYVLISVKPSKDKKDKNAKCYRTIIKSVGAEATTAMINSGSINRIANKHYDKKDQFLAIPQILYMNEDGSYTIVFEENRSNTYSNSGFRTTTVSNGVNGTTTYASPSGGSYSVDVLEDIGIIEYDSSGTEKISYYIPKSQRVKDIPRSIYYSFRDETGVKLDDGTQFKSFYFLNGKTKRYVLLNDIARNQEKVNDGKKVTTIQGLDECEAYAFEIGNGDNMPKRQLIFADKEHKKEKDMALFAISDFDRENNVFVTLKLEHIKGDKEVKLVWLQPE